MANAMEMAVPAWPTRSRTTPFSIGQRARGPRTLSPGAPAARGRHGCGLPRRTREPGLRAAGRAQAGAQAFATATTEERFERERRILAALKRPEVSRFCSRGGRTEEGQAFLHRIEHSTAKPSRTFAVVLRHHRARASAAPGTLALRACAPEPRRASRHQDHRTSGHGQWPGQARRLWSCQAARPCDQHRDDPRRDATMTPTMLPRAIPPRSGHCRDRHLPVRRVVLCSTSPQLPYRPDPNDNLAWAKRSAKTSR